MGTGILGGALMAASTGLGCGTCCGTGVSVFLMGYLSTHTKSFRETVRAFASFYLGKLTAVAALCVISSFLGRRLMDEQGKIGIVDVHLAADLLMTGLGVWMILRWFRERKHHSCSSCGHCGPPETEAKSFESGKQMRVSKAVLWGMGAGYGISPCAPLLLVAGYAATVQPAAAALTGTVFALCSALVPMLMLLFLSGIISSRIHREIPEYLDYFRLLFYLFFIIVFTADLVL